MTKVMHARHAERRGLPSKLPADDIEALPGFGRSWYRRGPTYWLRRGFLALVMVIMLGLACEIEFTVLTSIWSNHSATKREVETALLALAFVASFVQPVRTFRTGEQRRRAGLLLRPDLLPGGVPLSDGTSGGRLRTLLRTGDRLMSASLLLAVVFHFGWIMIMFIWAFQREYGIEHDARLRLQQHLAQVPVPRG